MAKLKMIWQMVLSSTPGPKYCSRCGAANDASAAYCVGCGMQFNY